MSVTIPNKGGVQGSCTIFIGFPVSVLLILMIYTGSRASVPTMHASVQLVLNYGIVCNIFPFQSTQSSKILQSSSLHMVKYCGLVGQLLAWLCFLLA